MALNNSIISIIVLFFILSCFTGEAQNTSPPVAKEAKHKDPSNCAKEYIKTSMEDTAAKCKMFVKKQIDRRLEDPSLVRKDRKCLMSCYGGYLAAIVSVTKGVADVSTGRYIQTLQDVAAFSLAIAPCMRCSAELTLNDPEFWEFQKWAKHNADDLHDNLKSCTQ